MTKRMTLPPLGEHDDDWLRIMAWLNNSSKSTQAANLIGLQIREEKPKVEKMLEYIAQKRGVAVSELIKSILDGTIDDDRDDSIDEE